MLTWTGSSLIHFLSRFHGAVRLGLASVLVCVCLASYSIVFFPGASRLLQPASGLFAAVRFHPQLRNDFQEVGRLLRILDSLLTNPEDRLYVLASSALFNSELLRNAHLVLNRTPLCEPQIFGT